MRSNSSDKKSNLSFLANGLSSLLKASHSSLKAINSLSSGLLTSGSLGNVSLTASTSLSASLYNASSRSISTTAILFLFFGFSSSTSSSSSITSSSGTSSSAVIASLRGLLCTGRFETALPRWIVCPRILPTSRGSSSSRLGTLSRRKQLMRSPPLCR
ncbi:hypothetical protein HAV1_gp23 [Hyperthermophilic Archaeal Virus 1]|uniref:hypothetical protein n=1 Tax=Hyperthermophilic Archaeal Virus 1 TaxID=762905 RepID=UPI0001DBAE02|nr:hypothetical protein HAV1_gp23 [Hyperthermophilic Archaeal Virus 1]ADJ54246.1 hypothetical protein HAV1_gp23 [Hyperthermophilic Archaeal Virus 1]